MSDLASRSIRSLFVGNKKNLLQYLTRKVGPDDAADILQETFARVLRHERLDSIADPPAFLMRIAINLTRDFARCRRTEAKYIQFGDYVVERPSDDAPLEERIEFERNSRQLRAAVESLPPRCGEVFRLHVYEDVSFQEIARRLQISDRMVRKHMTLALRTCRAALRSREE